MHPQMVIYFLIHFLASLITFQQFSNVVPHMCVIYLIGVDVTNQRGKSVVNIMYTTNPVYLTNKMCVLEYLLLQDIKRKRVLSTYIMDINKYNSCSCCRE